MRVAQLHPAVVPEWEAEDMLAGRLGDETWKADEAEARAMLDRVRLELPTQAQHTDLAAFAAERATPLDAKLVADGNRYDFSLVGLPIATLVPEDRRLVRLRLRVTLENASAGAPPEAYDVFPTTEWTATEHKAATVSVDVGKALFVVLGPVGDALGLKLELPFRYTTHEARVQSTGPNSNPVEWLVKDARIKEGFVAYLIIRAAKDAAVELHGELACELRRRGPFGRILRATYASDEVRYLLADSP
jgi:hypothetical protein